MRSQWVKGCVAFNKLKLAQGTVGEILSSLRQTLKKFLKPATARVFFCLLISTLFLSEKESTTSLEPQD